MLMVLMVNYIYSKTMTFNTFKLISKKKKKILKKIQIEILEFKIPFKSYRNLKKSIMIKVNQFSIVVRYLLNILLLDIINNL